jgi:hypothetical protein
VVTHWWREIKQLSARLKKYVNRRPRQMYRQRATFDGDDGKVGLRHRVAAHKLKPFESKRLKPGQGQELKPDPFKRPGSTAFNLYSESICTGCTTSKQSQPHHGGVLLGTDVEVYDSLRLGVNVKRVVHLVVAAQVDV